MNSATGKRIRLGRLLSSDTNRGLIIAYSHGLLLGPQMGMRTVREMEATIDACRAADGIMISPGMVDRLAARFVGRGKPSLVVHLDWSNFSRRVLPYPQGSQVSLAAVEEVAAAGADAVMSYLLLGFEDARAEALEIERNARLARACERSGLVLMIEPRYAGERIHSARKTETAIMQLYCRISAEVGADLVKVIWPGSSEAMNALAESCPAPLLVAGGERNASKEGEVFDVARCAINAGASGLVFGRKVYQAPNPGKIVAKLREIVDLPGDRQPD